MIDLSKIDFNSRAKQRLLQIYAVLYFMEQGYSHTKAIQSALTKFKQVKDSQTIHDKCARQFAGNIGTFVEWHRLGIITSKLKEKLHINEHDINIFKKLLKNENHLLETKSVEDAEGIFGKPEDNKTVEEFAINYTVNLFQNEGWYVESVESLKCGFDLLCTRDEEILNVEVKGTSGTELKFIMTKNEVKEAEINPNFLLIVVTNANTNLASHFKFQPKELFQKFTITPLEFLVNQKNL